jgi:hypothetical protein
MSLNLRRRLVVLLLPALSVALALQVQAQQKNEVGLVIGATTSPGIGLTSGNVAAPTQNLRFDSSLALGAEYDRRLNSGNTAFYVGVDFLASPLDVKLNQPQTGISPQFAYLFLTPHVRVKFHSDGALKPWLEFGGGYARFRESAPATALSFRPGSNTGSLEFGGGIDTAPIVHVFRIPIGFRLEVRDFYSGTPNFNAPLDSRRLNSVAYTGGLLLKF